ncbi:Crp/Fnr family transcriptional regulator [Echinicola strongylocentroti]|uniref:Crp/Fnr family transcriptional regulator n=1 Tax=Echinicola strongylocentroti TaxID=1795355 RepID=A0A2Z4IK45_9BACT|nr:Crp/Fnr family transcriptional regulator [Echinicola strongylocentroti]AWW30753.1 Crp/Fnr family transcriptional regulator [Echinicola strongylocentroti]
MNDQLLKNIAKYVTLSPDEIDLFRTFWTEKTLLKGDYLLRNGEVSKSDNYVVTGALKAFYISDKGNEEILYFAIDDWWATDILSFQKQTPSIYTIQALEDTLLLQIHRDSFQEMLQRIPTLETYFRSILESYVGSLQQRIITSNSSNAEQNYIDFIEKYPKISAKVPQYLIASYLGVTPEFISRIRKRK